MRRLFSVTAPLGGGPFRRWVSWGRETHRPCLRETVPKQGAAKALGENTHRGPSSYEERGSGDQTGDDLRRDIGRDIAPLEALRGGEADGDGRVEVATGDVPDGIRHRQHGQSEGESDTGEADAHLNRRRRRRGDDQARCWRGTSTSSYSSSRPAATGIASSAPITPSRVPPASAATTVTAPGTETVRAMIFGAMT